jgi:hypothetical protein
VQNYLGGDFDLYSVNHSNFSLTHIQSVDFNRYLTNTFWNPTGQFAVSIGHDYFHCLTEFFFSNSSIIGRYNLTFSNTFAVGGVFVTELDYIIGNHN